MVINLRTLTLYTLYRHPRKVLASIKSLLAEYHVICAAVGEYRTEIERLRRDAGRVAVLSKLYATVGSDGTQN